MTPDTAAKELLLDNNTPNIATKILAIKLYLDKLTALKQQDEYIMQWCDEAEALYQKVDCLLIDEFKFNLDLQKKIAEAHIDKVNKYDSWFIFNRDITEDKID